jgi:hypothetical protein
MIKKLIVSLSYITLAYGEYIYISPHKEVLKDSYVRGYYSDDDSFGFSMGLLDKMELFAEDKKDKNSLYGIKLLLKKEKGFIPALYYSVVESKVKREYIFLRKKFSYFYPYFGYEKNIKRFYGGFDFDYSPSFRFSFQYDENLNKNLWMKYNFNKNISLCAGRFDKKSMAWISYKFDFSKNYIIEKTKVKDNAIALNQNSDELENIFNSIDTAYDDINITIKNHSLPKKHIFITSSEFNAFKKQRVSKEYMRDAISLTRDVKSKKNSFDFDIYVEPKYNLTMSGKKPSSSDLTGFAGVNIGFGLPIFVTYEAKISSEDIKTKKSSLNLVLNNKDNFFKVESGEIYHKNSYDIEYLKTFKSERYGVGLVTQKYGDKKATFLSLHYIPKISKTISLNLKIGKFFYNKKALDLSIKKFYKDFILGSNIFITKNSYDCRARVYLKIPLNFGRMSIAPTMDIQTYDYQEDYIDSQNSFENTIFNKNNITLQKELL